MSAGIQKTGDWGKAIRIFQSVAENAGKSAQRAILKEGHFFRTQIITGIREQAPGGKPFVPLSPNTLRVRALEGFRGSKALMVRGDLRNGIQVIDSPEGVFIGVLRTARAHDGESLMNIVDILERGRGPFLVPITKASRGYLAAAGVMAPGPGGFVIIKIPPRPIFQPVFDKYGSPDQVRQRILSRMAADFKGQIGGV